MTQDTPSRHLDQYLLRFPDGMRERLKEEAARNGRSLNAEIVHHLHQALETASLRLQPGVPVDQEQMQAIVQAAHQLSQLIKDAQDKHEPPGE